MGIETITGDLRTYKELVRGTMMCVDQLNKERITNEKLRENCFYAGDGNLFFICNTDLKWAITRELANPVLNNIDSAFNQLINSGNYNVTPADLETALNNPATVVLYMAELGLTKFDEDWSCLTVDTSKKLSEYNEEVQKVLKRLFGHATEDYSATMNMLSGSHQTFMKNTIWVPNPEYIEKNARIKPICRASRLGNFANGSFFSASGRNVDNRIAVRGERRVA